MAVIDNATAEIAEAEEDNCCGIVMPISSIDGCSDSHWKDVLDILKDAIVSTGMRGNLVSYADDSAVIHRTIVRNLYRNKIVVCDVSCKNPNVMFELGMRLAFNKPTVIVKDEQTRYSFDTSVIEHIEYPRDLRFSKIIEFKSKLADKIRATLEASAAPNYNSFLKQFGEFTVAEIEKTTISEHDYLENRFEAIEKAIHRLGNQLLHSGSSSSRNRSGSLQKVYVNNSRDPLEIGDYLECDGALLGKLWSVNSSGIVVKRDDGSLVNIQFNDPMMNELGLSLV